MAKIIRHGRRSKPWVGRVLNCNCGCSFQLEIDDIIEWKNLTGDLVPSGGVVECPYCKSKTFYQNDSFFPKYFDDWVNISR